MTLWDVFESAARRFADRAAVEVQRAGVVEAWTYQQLRDEAIRRSQRLRAMGVCAGDRCAILADNDAAWCATYLAILRIGALAVPLDTNYSVAQVLAVVADAGPRVLFVNRRLEGIARIALERTDVRCERIDPPTTQEQAIAEDASDSIDSGAPAVILYTSGTTADPKGVVLTHANLIAERDAAFSIVRVDERDSVLGVLPLFHALAQLANLLLPFAVGARVVFLETIDSAGLVQALAERRITIFACVPQVFYLIHQRIARQVARRGPLARLAFRALLATSFSLRRAGLNAGPWLFRRVHESLGADMRLFITGGSKFDPAIGRDFYALGFTILQAYGLTETSGAATLTGPDEAYLDTVGRALPGQSLEVLSSNDPGLDGEIAIRGPIVMQGYFNKPEATAAVMQDGWLLTGDLGRLDERGRLTITGRRKEVIVLASGKNVYPEEIEAAYQQSPFIKEICVMGLASESEPRAERLFAAVVPDMELMQERRIANAGDLLRFEMEGQAVHLPPHKRVLGYEVWFEALPRTTTGKLKRHEVERRITEKRRHRQEAVSDVRQPAWWSGDAHATAAIDIIARRARHAPIAPGSSLELDLGCDSMERVELLAELEQRFGVKVSDEHAHHILTVGQLIDAVRPSQPPSATLAAANDTAVESWEVLLRDLPSADDPVLGGLLRSRRLDSAAFFALLRVLRVFAPRVAASGLERLPASGPYIISPNHQSYLDPFFLCAVLPHRVLRQLFFVGAAEYFETPVTAWLARRLNLVPVDPDANLLPAMRAGAFGLTHGKILVLFPEGERSIDGTVKRFKKGGAILSRHLGVPIVPVAMHGVYEIWPRNRQVNWRMLLPWTRHRVQIRFGPPMQIDATAAYADGATALRARVGAMWDELNRSGKQRAEQEQCAGDAAREENA